MKNSPYDLIVIGATPGGIATAIAAGRRGLSVLLLEGSHHVGGLPANGLGATDIDTREVAGGIFLEFVERIKGYYRDTYGSGSPQLAAASEGYRFEPRVAEQVFHEMLKECANVSTRLGQLFDPQCHSTVCRKQRGWVIRTRDTDTGSVSEFEGKILSDATYEGDVLAATGTAYRLGRESSSEHGEPFAGEIYMGWQQERHPASSGHGDNGIQAYNYRLCVTKNPENRAPIVKPGNYRLERYEVLLQDILEERFTGPPTDELYLEGIGRCLNLVPLPNEKYDANNQHLAFQSSDLPEENWPWPTSRLEWRSAFAQHLKDYTLGLLWFVQNDPRLPKRFRKECAKWGLAKDEYKDNDHFPRQVYVREGRRLVGTYLFTGSDSWRLDGRPVPERNDSIAASHYSLDSHAVHKYQPGYPHLEGFFNVQNHPYSIPYGVILPERTEDLLAPVPVSSTHIGFSTLRMEPCWMAMGHAAGLAAYLAISTGCRPRDISVAELQQLLREEGAVIQPSEITESYAAA